MPAHARRSRRKKIRPFFLIVVFAMILVISVSLIHSCSHNSPDTPTDTSNEPSQSTDLQATDSEIDTLPEASDSDSDPRTDDTETTDKSTQTSDSPAQNTPQPSDQPQTSKRVAFTFDDGPHGTYTKQIADKVAEYGGHVTYFVVGNRIKGEQKQACAYAAAKGNEIGIHGYTHTVYYNNCSESDYKRELADTASAIVTATGAAPTLLRPIGGSITKERIAACPYAVITWNVDSRDWKYKTKSQENVDIIVNNILSTVRDGSIVLMHDIYENSYKAFCICLEKLSEEGYEFVTVSELLDNPSAGVKYRCAES